MTEQIQFLNKEQEKLKQVETDPTLLMLLKYRDEILAMLNDIKDEPELNNVFVQFSDGLNKLNSHIRIVEDRLNIPQQSTDNEIQSHTASKAA